MTLESFLEATCAPFDWLGGVARDCVYDDPRSVVAKRERDIMRWNPRCPDASGFDPPVRGNRCGEHSMQGDVRMAEIGEAKGAGDAGAEETTGTSIAATQVQGQASGGDGDATVTDAADGGDAGGRSKAAAVGAGTVAAAVAITGGIVAAARDTRRRIFGVPIGKRSRLQRAAGTVVANVREPTKKLSSRFRRDGNR
jgi:hypothetical protein